MTKLQILLVAYITITVFVIGGLSVQHVRVRKKLRIANSIIYCYEHPCERKSLPSRLLRKGWEK